MEGLRVVYGIPNRSFYAGLWAACLYVHNINVSFSRMYGGPPDMFRQSKEAVHECTGVLDVLVSCFPGDDLRMFSDFRLQNSVRV